MKPVLSSSGRRKEMYSCEMCMAMFDRECLMQNHVQKSHFLTVQDIRIFSCERCDFRTGHFPTYQIHNKASNCDPTKVFFKCDFCDQLLVTKFNRKAHCKIFHADKLEGNMKIFRCANCKYKVGDENYFYEHKLKCKTGSVAKVVHHAPLQPKEAPKSNTVKIQFGLFAPGEVHKDA